MIEDCLTFFSDKPSEQTFTAEHGGDAVTINQQKMLRESCAIMVHYLRYNSDYAFDMLENTGLAGRITNYHEARAIAQYSPYHWAMLTAHGHKYWQEGFCIDQPEDIQEFIAKLAV